MISAVAKRRIRRQRSEREATGAMIARVADMIYTNAAPVTDILYDLPSYTAKRLRIRTKDDRLVPFRLNGIQLEVRRRMQAALRDGRPPRFIILKYRRGGITTFMCGIGYRLTTSRRLSTVLILAHTKSHTARIFRIPLLMHGRDFADPGDDDAFEGRLELTLENFDSTIYVDTAGGSGVARSDTLSLVHGSEVAYWNPGPNQVDEQRRTLAGLTEAASHGFVTLESTPNGSELFKELYDGAKIGANEWTPIFLPWFIDAENTVPRRDLDPGELAPDEGFEMSDDEVALIARAKADYGVDITVGQILWRRLKKTSLGVLFPQEYPEDDVSCFLSAGVCYFDVESLRVLNESLSVNGAKRTHLAGGYKLIWKAPVAGRKYVVGVDCAEGIPGRDRVCIGVLDRETGEQVAVVHGIFKPKRTAELTAAIGKLYNRAFVGVERNNHGHAVLLHLREIGYGNRRDLYHAPSQSKRDRKPHRQGGVEDRPGWVTDSQSRPILLSDLSEAVESGAMKVVHRELVQEMLSFALQSSGKYSANSGEHDDTVFAWGIAWQMRKSGPISLRVREL